MLNNLSLLRDLSFRFSLMVLLNYRLFFGPPGLVKEKVRIIGGLFGTRLADFQIDLKFTKLLLLYNVLMREQYRDMDITWRS